MTSDKSTAAKNESSPKAASDPSEGASKSQGSAPSDYSRGEKQKPVSVSYTDNWDSIFAKKKKKKKTKR
jgi:hypothetical protein